MLAQLRRAGLVVKQRGLLRTADLPTTLEGLTKGVIELFIFQENPEGTHSHKTRLGSGAASKGVARGEPASQATVNQGFKTFIDIYLYSSK